MRHCGKPATYKAVTKPIASITRRLGKLARGELRRILGFPDVEISHLHRKS